MSLIEKYILAIDQSTSATKAILFTREGKLYGRTTVAHQQFYPQLGYVEHDPMEIFENTLRAIKKVMAEANMSEDNLEVISITNQRETSLIWDKTTGVPIANAAVWQCLRGADICNELKSKGYSDLIRSKTGLVIDPYFSASKLKWTMDNTVGLKEKAEKGELLLGTMDSWLLWKFTNGKVHATDFSNASRTMLFNIKTLDWDDEIIEIFGLKRNMFPQVRFSDEIFGYTSTNVIFSKPLPIAGLLGDSHGALFGQNCFLPGMAKATYGTGSSIAMNIGATALDAPEGLVTSVGFGINGKVDYIFEGNIHCTGDTINWLKNEMGLINSASETEGLANSVDSTNGTYLVPAFVGLGAPYWDNSARASILGMNRDTTKAHVVRAALESIAYQVKDLIDLMVQDGGIELKELRVDGGPTRNNFLMQFQSDMLGRDVVRSTIEEVSALGAAFMAGLASGFWGSLDEIKALYSSDHTFSAVMDARENKKLYAGWKKAVERTRL